jgi:hypothetical protein
MNQCSFRLTTLMLVIAFIFSWSSTPAGSDLSLSNNTAIPEVSSSVVASESELSQVQSNPKKATLDQTFNKMPLIFIKNQGQIDNQVGYYLQGQGTFIYFATDGLTFDMNFPSMDTNRSDKSSEDYSINSKYLKIPSAKLNRWTLKLDFLSSNRGVLLQGEDQAETVISYFKGSPDNWHTGVPTFHRLVYRDLWPGIDLVYSGTSNRLKYEFIVQPGADPSQIRLSYHGVIDLKVNSFEQMEVSTPYGSIQDEAPIAYQVSGEITKPVAISYKIKGYGQQRLANTKASAEEKVFAYSFQISGYDPSLPLIIDPAVLIYCGYIGGSGDDRGYDIAIDASGAVYITGFTISNQATFPVSTGPDLTYNGDATDAYVAKVSADGKELIYAGYIGGSGVDEGYGIAVDSSGAAYISGRTTSDQASFPVRGGPDLSFNGGADAFVVKVRPDGTDLEYAGYIGGNNGDGSFAIAIDKSGAAYVSGLTFSDHTTFPVVVGPDLSFNGNMDAFVTKVLADGSGLVYAGYIGGNGDDRSYGISVDESGAAYVAGVTTSDQATFPVSVGPDLTYNGGEDDGFVIKVQPDGTGLAYSGYIGGEGSDWIYCIVIDASGAVYATGKTESDQTTFPVSLGPDLSYNGGYYGDTFVAKVRPDGAGLVYAGYIGGDSLDWGFGIAVDRYGATYVTGETGSDETTFPVKGGPDLTYNGGGYGDAFIAKVYPDGRSLAYAGYIGGSDSDWGFGIAVDERGSAYVVGITLSGQATFPVIGGPDLTYNGGSDWGDAFVAKINFNYQLYLPMIVR